MPQPARLRPSFSRLLTLLLIVAAAVYLVGNEAVPLWDRDEPRYAQTSRQMLQSGDWVVPRFLDDVRTAKPPLIYWCQAIAMKLIGRDTAFAARLPSGLAMLATIAIVALWLRARVGRRRAIWAAFILATSALSIAAAKMCMTDSVLLLWVTVAQICLYEIVERRGTWIAWIAMGIAVGCAGLTKGPVVLGTMGTTIVVLGLLIWIERRLRRRRSGNPDQPIRDAASGDIPQHKAVLEYQTVRPTRSLAASIFCALVASAIVAIICVPWLILIHQREPQFLARIIGHDVINRIGSGLEGHKGPPGYYLLLIWGTLFPWSLLLPATIVHAWRNRDDPLTRFALASVIGPWLMFEIVQTKLPHYVLPIFPWLAVLTAGMLWSRDAKRRRAFVAIGSAWCIVVAVAYGGVLPFISSLQVSRRVADVLKREGSAHPGDAIMIDYKEPSLAFYQGGTIREESNDDYLSQTDPASWPRWIVLTQRVWDALPADVRARLDVVEPRVRGWWYSKGREVEVIVVRKR